MEDGEDDGEGEEGDEETDEEGEGGFKEGQGAGGASVEGLAELGGGVEE